MLSAGLEIARANFGYKIGACSTKGRFGSFSFKTEHLPDESQEEIIAMHRACNLCVNHLIQHSCQIEIKHGFFFLLMQRGESSLDSALAVIGFSS